MSVRWGAERRTWGRYAGNLFRKMGQWRVGRTEVRSMVALRKCMEQEITA